MGHSPSPTQNALGPPSKSALALTPLCLALHSLTFTKGKCGGSTGFIIALVLVSLDPSFRSLLKKKRLIWTKHMQGLGLLGVVNVAMEGGEPRIRSTLLLVAALTLELAVVAAVENRFDEKKDLHAQGHYSNGGGARYQDDPAPRYDSAGRGGLGY